MTRKVDCLIYCLKFFDTQSQNSKQTANYKSKLAFMVSMMEKLEYLNLENRKFSSSYIWLELDPPLRTHVVLLEKIVVSIT